MRSTIPLGNMDYGWIYEVLLMNLDEGPKDHIPNKKRRADLAKLVFRGLPDLTEVVSSNVAKIGWKEQTLVIMYQNGSTYAYWGVEETIYQALKEAESKGKYVNRVIKADYECLQLFVPDV